MADKKISIFIDSGAYSALVQKKTINLEEYIAFIKENVDFIDIYANLDVIGDPKATKKNQLIMEAAGLNPIPCYHHNEDVKYLEYYLERYEYISLGGLVGAPTSVLMTWLDFCWNIICDQPSRLPKSRVHGFGLTSLRLMLRYPWYSVDSTSWVLTGRFGAVFVPHIQQGKWVYDENSWKVNVSNQSPSQKEEGRHFSTFAPAEKDVILQYFHDKGFVIGKSQYHEENRNTYKPKKGERWVIASRKLKQDMTIVETIIEPGLCNEYKKRDELNIMYFLDLEKSIAPYPWAFHKEVAEGFGLR